MRKRGSVVAKGTTFAERPSECWVSRVRVNSRWGGLEQARGPDRVRCGGKSSVPGSLPAITGGTSSQPPSTERPPPYARGTNSDPVARNARAKARGPPG